jgi:hypothetical protein
MSEATITPRAMGRAMSAIARVERSMSADSAPLKRETHVRLRWAAHVESAMGTVVYGDSDGACQLAVSVVDVALVQRAAMRRAERAVKSLARAVSGRGDRKALETLKARLPLVMATESADVQSAFLVHVRRAIALVKREDARRADLAAMRADLAAMRADLAALTEWVHLPSEGSPASATTAAYELAASGIDLGPMILDRLMSHTGWTRSPWRLASGESPDRTTTTTTTTEGK